jgi:hypothetical protein
MYDLETIFTSESLSRELPDEVMTFRDWDTRKITNFQGFSALRTRIKAAEDAVTAN